MNTLGEMTLACAEEGAPSTFQSETAAAGARSAFDRAPTAMWAEDLSAVARGLTRLRQQGVEDIDAWIAETPGRYRALADGFRIQACNAEAATLFGAPDAATLFARLGETWLPEMGEVIREKIRALWEGRGRVRATLPFRRLDGLVVRVSYSMNLPEGGERLDRVLVGLAAVGAESTADLGASSDVGAFEASLGAAQLGLWDYDVATDRMRLDVRGERILGAEPGSLASEPGSWLAWVDAEDRGRVEAALRSHLDGLTPFLQVEARLRALDGSLRWVLLTGRIHQQDEDGSPARAGGALIDITPRRTRLERRRQGEQRFHDLVEQAPLGMVLVGPAGRITLTNPAFCASLGSLPRDLHGSTFADLVVVEDQERFEQTFAEASQREGWVAGVDCRLLRRQGDPLWMRLTLFGVSGAGVGGEGILIHAQDIGERRAREREHERTRLRSEETQRVASLGLLAGSVAHDVSSLLSGITTNVRIARHRLGDGHGAAANLLHVESSIEQAFELTRKMKAYAGGQALQTETLDLAPMLEALPRTAGSRLDATPLHVVVDGPLWPVHADTRQLHQALEGLVDNARQAIGDGSGTILVRARALVADAETLAATHIDDGLPQGRYVQIDVVDDGAGIDPDLGGRAFEPFVTTRSGAQGLGLAEVLGIVRAHRGAIRLDAQPGGGTRVRILLPASGVHTTPNGSDKETGVLARVLLIHDDPRMRVMVREALVSRGHEVHVAEEGSLGVRTFAQERGRIDLVVVDISRIGLTDLQVITRLRQLAGDVRILLASTPGHAPGVALEGPRPAVLIDRPYSPDDLAAQIQALGCLREETTS